MNRVAAASGAIAVVVVLAIGAQSTASPASAPLSQPASIPHDASAGDLGTLQRAVPGIMTDWIAAGRVDGEVGDRNELGMIMASLSKDAVSQRRELLSGVLTPRLVEPQVGQFGDQFWFALYRMQPASIYIGNRFEVAEWMGAEVLGDVARVLVSARQLYTFPNGTEGAEPWHRYLLVLERAPESRYGWLLIERSSTPLPRAGSDSLSDR
jgi:hypothetical protein